jgi:hypothetical protein
MLFKFKQAAAPVLRPRITPDPDQVAALQQRMEALRYQPENGFHRDRLQSRQAPRLRFAR